NTGFTIRGMDLAAGSALAVAGAAGQALDSGDLSQKAMDRYRTELDATFVGHDMKTYAKAPAFLENPRMYRDAGLFAADVLHGIFGLDTTPRTRLTGTVRRALRHSTLTARSLVSLGLGAVRGL
ncbi:MAG TPA: hypothetical protein VHA75_13370, partial [Rugosimonospora sp.]|nr:hypothetical protein [Rugosimonospora sp.]